MEYKEVVMYIGGVDYSPRAPWTYKEINANYATNIIGDYDTIHNIPNTETVNYSDMIKSFFNENIQYNNYYTGEYVGVNNYSGGEYCLQLNIPFTPKIIYIIGENVIATIYPQQEFGYGSKGTKDMNSHSAGLKSNGNIYSSAIYKVKLDGNNISIYWAIKESASERARELSLNGNGYNYRYVALG